MKKIRLKSPEPITAFCYQGESFDVAGGRYIEVPEAYAINLYASGYVNADEADKLEKSAKPSDDTKKK